MGDAIIEMPDNPRCPACREKIPAMADVSRQAQKTMPKAGDPIICLNCFSFLENRDGKIQHLDTNQFSQEELDVLQNLRSGLAQRLRKGRPE